MSVKEHIKIVMEFFQEVAVIGDAVSDHNRVGDRLAWLSDAYDMLVIALKAQSETVLKWNFALKDYCTRNSNRTDH